LLFIWGEYEIESGIKSGLSGVQSQLNAGGHDDQQLEQCG